MPREPRDETDRNDRESRGRYSSRGHSDDYPPHQDSDDDDGDRFSPGYVVLPLNDATSTAINLISRCNRITQRPLS